MSDITHTGCSWPCNHYGQKRGFPNFSHPIVLFTSCESSGDLVKMQILIQELWGGEVPRPHPEKLAPKGHVGVDMGRRIR